MTKKNKWGIIGPGKIAEKFAQDLLLSENAELYAIASRNPKKANDFAEKFNPTKIHNTYTTLAADKEVDIVYIATPHSFHYEQTMLCLHHNKAVLCEKPLGISTVQVQKMIAEARKRKLFLMEAMWTRFIPATEKLLALIENNTIGKIHSVEADFGFHANFDPQHRLFNPTLAGGALLDIGIYPLYLAMLIMGKPLSTQLNVKFAPTGVDTDLIIQHTYANQAKALLKASLVQNTPIEAHIRGEKGIITLHSRFHHCNKITWQLHGAPPQIIEIPYTGFGYFHEIEAVNNYLQLHQTESPLHSLQTSLYLMQIMETIKNDF